MIGVNFSQREGAKGGLVEERRGGRLGRDKNSRPGFPDISRGREREPQMLFIFHQIFNEEYSTLHNCGNHGAAHHTL